MKIGRYVAAAAAALLLSAPAWAQEKPKEGAQAASKKVSGIGVNTSTYDGAPAASTASLTFFTLPKSELWLVGGQDYSPSKNDFDVGLKYIKGKSQVRGTVASSDKGFDRHVSAGMDWDTELLSYENGGVSLLGDVSSVGGEERRAHFGLGAKARLNKNHNGFYIHSDRDSKSHRGGYMFLDDKKIAALVVNYPEGGKAAFEGYLGLPEHRFVAWYDPNNNDISSVNILTFGNKPLPYYARATFLSNQIILSQNSVRDSDFLHLFQSPFFLDPKGKMSDVLRLHFSYDTGKDKLRSLYLYNALLLGNGTVLTQNVDKSNGKMYYGGGFGHRFGHMTPVLIFQTGGQRRLTLDFNFSY